MANFEPQVIDNGNEEEIMFAYEVMSDNEKRRVYDRYGEEGIKRHADGGGRRGGGMDLEDIIKVLPGDFGFDPLGLGSDPETLKWFAQAELMHSRWAMLAVAGILIQEWLESLGFIDNFSWFDAGSREYFADSTTLFVVQLALMGWIEGRRWADIINPGSVDIEPNLPNRKRPKPDVGYPGGLWFDPFMWGRGSPEPVMVLRTKEIKNGRLAMLGFTGFVFQAIYTAPIFL